MSIVYRNQFGSSALSGTSYDLGRSDLFRVDVVLPAALSNAFSWQDDISWAVQSFPFPTRSIDEITVKYLQQVNKMPGADAAAGDVDMVVRYAFTQRTAQALETWFRLVSNPLTGGVGLASAVKSYGQVTHLIPNMNQQVADLTRTSLSNDNSALYDGLQWTIEGMWPKSFKMSELDHTKSNEAVTCTVTWACDRWYPTDINAMAQSV